MDKVTMSVQEMAMQMGISLSKAYALTREDGFPIVRVGKRVLIPVSEFKVWLSARATEKRWMVLFVEIRRKKWTYNESSISN